MDDREQGKTSKISSKVIPLRPPKPIDRLEEVLGQLSRSYDRQIHLWKWQCFWMAIACSAILVNVRASSWFFSWFFYLQMVSVVVGSIGLFRTTLYMLRRSARQVTTAGQDLLAVFRMLDEAGALTWVLED